MAGNSSWISHIILSICSTLKRKFQYFSDLNFENCRQLGLSAEPIYGHAHGEPAPDVEVADPDFPTGEEAKKQRAAAQLAENRVAAIMLESGVIFHSIFIGIDLGINPDPSVVRPLMIALMFHQVTFICSQLVTYS